MNLEGTAKALYDICHEFDIFKMLGEERIGDMGMMEWAIYFCSRLIKRKEEIEIKLREKNRYNAFCEKIDEWNEKWVIGSIRTRGLVSKTSIREKELEQQMAGVARLFSRA